MELITLNAELSLSKNEETSDINFTGLAFSGDAVDREYGKLGIDLSNINCSEKIPLLYNHDRNIAAIGSVNVSLNDGQLSIEDGVFYNDAKIPNSETIAALALRNHPLKLSIGVNGRIEKYNKQTAVMLNNRMQNVDCVLRDVCLNEVSVVNIPADKKTYTQNLGEQMNVNEHEDVIKLKEEVTFLKQEKKELLKKSIKAQLELCNIDFSDVELNAILNSEHEIILEAFKRNIQAAKESVKPNVNLSDVKPVQGLSEANDIGGEFLGMKFDHKNNLVFSK